MVTWMYQKILIDISITDSCYEKLRKRKQVEHTGINLLIKPFAFYEHDTNILIMIFMWIYFY